MERQNLRGERESVAGQWPVLGTGTGRGKFSIGVECLCPAPPTPYSYVDALAAGCMYLEAGPLGDD